VLWLKADWQPNMAKIELRRQLDDAHRGADNDSLYVSSLVAIMANTTLEL